MKGSRLRACTAFALCAIFAISTFGARPVIEVSADQGPMRPGIYSGTAMGLNFPVTVHVTVDSSSILEINALPTLEQPPTLVAAAIDHVISQMLEHQSVAVDVFAGATVTSMAVIGAVHQALDEAGANISYFMNRPGPVARTQASSESVDILIIGGGGAGMMAAMGATLSELRHPHATEAPTYDVNIMLVEQLGAWGGSTQFALGATFRTNGTEAGADELVRRATTEMSARDFQNIDLIRRLGILSNDTMFKLSALGSNYMIDTVNERPWNGMQFFPIYDDVWNWGPRGYNLTDFLARRISMLPQVDARLNTRATELIVEDGEVVGARMRGPYTYYDVFAEKIIIATGGFVHNREMIERLVPGQANSIPHASAGHDGSGILMLEEIGAALVGENLLTYLGVDERLGIYSDLWPFLMSGERAVHVNVEGRRFHNDSQGHHPNYGTYTLMEQPQGQAFGIVGSNHPNVDVIRNTPNTGIIWSADSLEELAEMIGVPVDAFVQTITEYNAAYAEGIPAEFVTNHANMAPVLEAPFYAFNIRSIAIGTLISVKTSENLEPLRADGSTIPNVRIAGEMMLGGNILNAYYGGWSLGIAINSGRLAGELARNEVLANR